MNLQKKAIEHISDLLKQVDLDRMRIHLEKILDSKDFREKLSSDDRQLLINDLRNSIRTIEPSLEQAKEWIKILKDN